MNKSDRLKRAKDNLIGWDAAKYIRAAQRELRDEFATGRAIADREAPEGDLVLEVPVMLVEDVGGRWTVSTTKADMFQGQGTNFEVTDRSEKLAMAEFRFLLSRKLVGARFCKEDEARRLALKANIWAAGRVPYCRIVSAGGL